MDEKTFMAMDASGRSAAVRAAYAATAKKVDATQAHNLRLATDKAEKSNAFSQWQFIKLLFTIAEISFVGLCLFIIARAYGFV